MHQSYSTAIVRPKESQSYWNEIIGKNYFPLSLEFGKPEGFQGQLTAWNLGDLSVSRIDSEAACYRRQREHLKGEEESAFLVTIPEHKEVSFSQRGRSVRCAPGSFILERSDEPYEFSYARANSLWVVKVPAKAMSQRVGSLDRFCAHSLDASSGSKALFVGFVRLLAQTLAHVSEREVQALSRQFLDLLALALEDDDGISQSTETAVQAAHLQRIQNYIRANLRDSDLSPKTIALACGISPRYLHSLFKNTGRTVSQWVREQRLQACYDTLTNAAPLKSIAQIAYGWGFSDQSHFCRVFKEHFGCSPSQLRGRYRF